MENKKKPGKILGGLGRPFYLLWCGESISFLGTSLMEFALGVWIYQKTGSVLDFSGVILAAVLPQLLVLPFAGSVADRFDRRHVMVASDAATAALTLALAWLLWHGSLETAHLYAFNMLVSLFSAFRRPAYIASVSKLLPIEKLTKASGLMGISSNLLRMFSPILAGGLMALVGLPGIVSLDLACFCLGSVLILRAFFQGGKPAEKPKPRSAEHSGIAVAAAFFRREPLMQGMLAYAVIQQGLLTLASTMIMPLVLSHHSEKELGIVLTFGSIGGLFGAALLTAMGGLRRLMVAALTGDAALAFFILLAGIDTSFVFYCVCAFMALFASGFAEGCGNSLWMRKVPNHSQGRIFSIVTALVLATTALVTLAGGVAAEKILEPALMEGGALALTVGPWIGTGKGRGLGLMFIICGSLGMLVSVGAFATRLRRLDALVPDPPLPAED